MCSEILPNTEEITSAYFTYKSGIKLKKDYFNDYEDTRKWLKYLCNKKNFKTYDDMYNLKRKDFKDNYGGQLLVKYISISKILNKYIPEYRFYGFHFNPVHKEYLEKQENIRECMEYIFKKLHYNNIEDLYNIGQKEIAQFSFGTQAMAKYKGLIGLIEFAYPEHNWHHWRFKCTKYYFIDKKGNLNFEHIRYYMDWLGDELGFKCIDDFYKIKKEHFLEHFGSGLLSCKFNNCLIDIIRYAYPEHEWLEWKFGQTRRCFWSENGKIQKKKILKYMKWLESTHNINSLCEWYDYECKFLKNNYGGTLVSLFNGSLSSLLMYIYPHFDWDIGNFRYKPNGYWVNIDNRKLCIDKTIGRKLDNIYNVDLPAGLSRYYNNREHLIRSLYPEINIDISKLRKRKGKKGQIIIEKMFNEIINEFNDFEISYNYEDRIKNIFKEKSAFYIDYTLIIKNNNNSSCIKKLYIEVDGAQHFEDTSNWLPCKKQQNRDIYKMNIVINDKKSKIIRIFQPDLLKNKYYSIIKNFIINNINYTNNDPEYICLSDSNKYSIHKKKYINLNFQDITYDDVY